MVILQKLTSRVLIKPFVLTDVVPQITTVEKVHNQVERLAVLESVVHINKERAVELRQYLALIHNTFDAAFCQDSGLVHFFHSVKLLMLSFFALHSPNLSKTTLAYALAPIEVRLADG